MNLFVDTSVWSAALRRDTPADIPEVRALISAIESGQAIFTTGIVLQELLQGFLGPKSHADIVDRFGALPLLVPGRQDHIDAAVLRNHCRKRGVQVATIDALLAQLCIRHKLLLLTLDEDFSHLAKHCALQIWRA
jgi:predicted nucleic acid-binding protein